MDWFPTREAGLARLAHFAPRAGRAYADRRNYDLGPDNRDNVSCLSPWIRHRLIGEWEAAEIALGHHTRPACEKFVDEVFWRTYFKGWLEMRSGVWDAYRRECADAGERLNADRALARRVAAATDGRTGIACFDAWARELVERGYLHNHTRMWFASIWVFTLELPWALGADFFLRHLLDGDPASNTLGWRWVAGLQTPGKTYRARPENIAKYTAGRFQPLPGELAEEAPAPEAATAPPPGRAPEPGPLPSLDGDIALLVTEDELDPTSLPVDPTDIDRVGILDCSAGRSAWPCSEAVQRFTAGAIDDAIARLAARGIAAERLAGPNALSAWLRRGADRLLVTHPPVGPARDALGDLDGLVGSGGPPVTRLLRPWDARAWPCATRGFFRFRKQIPRLLAEAGLAEGGN
jgi:deoxyribodipyrimidine photo-lyase